MPPDFGGGLDSERARRLCEVSRARTPKDPRLPLTTRVLDEGPTAAVAPDDLESRVYRECSPAAAGRVLEISERRTRAPDSHRDRPSTRTSQRPLPRRSSMARPLQSVRSQQRLKERTCLQTRQRPENPCDGSRSLAPE